MIRRLLARLNINLPSLPTSPPAHQPSRSTLFQLTMLIALAVLAHFSIANLIVGFFALGTFAYKAGLIYFVKPPPPRLLMMLLSISSLVLIVILYGGWNGQQAGISFLVVLVSLKFLESRTLRDYYVVCLILYFLAASTFLFDSSILSISLIMVYTLAITVLLLKLSSPSPINWHGSLGSASAILAKALPLAILLFFFFPRIHSSFGFLPSQDQLTDDGLNNSLVTGDLSSSAFDNSLAFRVEFEGRVPPYSRLYWRSKVMPVENNFSWSIGSPITSEITQAKRKAEQTGLDKGEIRYRILHEKSSDFFLPYLDYVVGFSKGKLLNDYSVWDKTKTGGFSYQGSSTEFPSLPEAETGINRNLLLQTKSQPSARTQALLTKWRGESSDHLELANIVYRYFIANDFRYSLLPPELGDDPIGDFLFETRVGYCEHYASTFTTLMRWLGVPARVVVGYHGGQLNQTGQYLQVRYSDAHAWSEIWVDGQWTRIDPTAAISPDRIEFGMDAFLSLWDGSPIGRGSRSPALSNFLNPTGADRYLRLLRENWENIGYQWNKWIVNYSFEKQQALLGKLGLEHRNSLYTLVVILFGGSISLLLLYFWNQIPRPVKRGEAQRVYLKFVSRFKRFGVIKAPADTPNEFAVKAKQRFPMIAAEIDLVTKAYLNLRYGREAGELRSFRQLVNQFKIRSDTQAS